jgi:hypothetical protein
MRLIEILRERGNNVDDIEQFVELNAFAVQYRYESLYSGEDPLDRLDVAGKIKSLLERIAAIVDA